MNSTRKTIFLLLGLLCTFLTYSANDLKITQFDQFDRFNQSHVNSGLQDSDGLIWLGSWNGLVSYNGYSFTTYKSRPGDGSPLESNRIDYVAPFSATQLVCQSSSGFYAFNKLTHRFTNATAQQRAALKKFYNSKRYPDSIKRLVAAMPEYSGVFHLVLFVDYQGGIWVESNRGLERIVHKRLTVGPHKFGSDKEEIVRGLYQDKKGRLWMADKNGYVRVVDHGTTLFLSPSGQLTHEVSRFGPSVYTILQDHNGDIWLGCKPGGLIQITSSGKMRHYMPNKNDAFSISDDQIYHIAEDYRHRIVVATYRGGVNFGERQADGTMRFYNKNNQLSHYPSEAMVSRAMLIVGKTLIVGSKHGLFTCDLTKPYSKMAFYRNIRKPNVASSLTNNYVTDIERLADGSIYLSTFGGGVDKITSRNLLSQNITFEHYSTLNGITSDQCLALAGDTNGNLWIVSDATLCCLNPRTGISTHYIIDYFEGKFIFNDASPICLSNGDIYFGTSQGTLVFNPSRMGKSSFVPRIALNCPDTVILQPRDPNLALRFAALDFNQTEAITYAYRLEGIDSTWHYTHSHELNYVGLKPGTYRLHLRSTNGDGVWVGNERTVLIRRKASFNETPVAWVLYSLLFALFVWGVVYVARYISRLEKELNQTRLTSNEKIELLGQQIKELLRRGRAEQIEAHKTILNETEKSQADRVAKLVADNIGNSDFTINELARELGISRTQLYVDIKRLFNTSPNNYILNVRIERGRKLLLDPHPTISEVAYSCGFTDPRYFSQCFRKITGTTPTDFRKGLNADNSQM